MSVGTTIARILRGEDDLSEWSDAELERGQRRLRDGSFPSRRPQVIATQLHDELVRRRLGRTTKLLQRSTPQAIRLLVKIVRDEEASNRDRIKAAELILDRALGKAPQAVDLHIDTEKLQPWQRMMAESIVPTEQDLPALPAAITVSGTKWLDHGPVADDWELDDTAPDTEPEAEPEPTREIPERPEPPTPPSQVVRPAMGRVARPDTGGG